jgi:hypothetical protein
LGRLQKGRLPSIEIETDNNGADYSGVWRQNTDNRGWISLRRLSDADFHAKWLEYKNKRYRPIDQDAEVIGGEMRYSLIVVENKENLGWFSDRNLSSAEFSKESNENKAKFRPIDISAVEYKCQMYNSVIWLENVENKDWAELRDMSPDSYGQKFDEYKAQGYRVVKLACYKRSGDLNFAAIWEKNEPGRGWAALRHMSAQGLANNWKKYRDQGMRVIDIEMCPAKSGGGVEYAAV